MRLIDRVGTSCFETKLYFLKVTMFIGEATAFCTKSIGSGGGLVGMDTFFACKVEPISLDALHGYVSV
jgi:hypothetical protein